MPFWALLDTGYRGNQEGGERGKGVPWIGLATKRRWVFIVCGQWGFFLLSTLTGVTTSLFSALSVGFYLFSLQISMSSVWTHCWSLDHSQSWRVFSGSALAVFCFDCCHYGIGVLLPCVRLIIHLMLWFSYFWGFSESLFLGPIIVVHWYAFSVMLYSLACISYGVSN